MKHLSKDQEGRIHADIGGFITVCPANFSRREALVEVATLHSYADESGVSSDWNSLKRELWSFFPTEQRISIADQFSTSGEPLQDNEG